MWTKKTYPDEIPVRLCNYTDVYYNQKITEDISFMMASVTEREIQRFKLQIGDVIITKDSESSDDITVPSYVAEELCDVVCGYHLAIIRPKNDLIHGSFLSQLLMTSVFNHRFVRIASFPGPDRSIRDQDMRKFRFLSRRYRNRRVGEFLKELEMTEGRGTGIPKILREIKNNGSPEPKFHTDKDRTFFLIEFPVHPAFAESTKVSEVTAEVTAEVTTEVTEEVKRLLKLITGDHSRKELQEMLGLKHAEHFRKTYLLPAIKAGFVGMTRPDKPKSRLQKYRLTEKGQAVLKKLEKARE
jgi:ATP-dependent DNA helicase RecG